MWVHHWSWKANRAVLFSCGGSGQELMLCQDSFQQAKGHDGFSVHAIDSAKPDVTALVDANQKKTAQNFETLKIKFVGPVSKFYAEAMKSIGTVFQRLASVKEAVKGISDDGNFFEAVSFM
jgi:hypothetical protein